MGTNFNISGKPEYKLQEQNIAELINLYGIHCKFLYSKKINKDLLVFNDFSHLKVEDGFKDIYLLPEDATNWDGETSYNNFGFFNQWTQTLFLSKESMYSLFPDFLETGRHELVNSLIVSPSSTVLEITRVSSYGTGINNLWSFADQPAVYILTVKIYDHNIADEGITKVKTTIPLEEEEIFHKDEEISLEVDEFFNSLETFKKDIDNESVKDQTGRNDTNSPFGNLS